MAGLKLSGGGSSLDNLSLAGKFVIGVMFVLLVAVAYVVVFYGEVDTNIESQRRTLQQRQERLAQAKEDNAAYNRDQTELENRRLLEKKQQKILPDEAQSHAFLSSIQTVATISGVKLTSWTPQDEVTADFYAKVPMELKLHGKFHQVAKFFRGVGQVDRIINMENIVIKAEPPKVAKAEGEQPEAEPVSVHALATAFRSLGADGQSSGRRRGAKGGGQKK